MAKSAEYVRFNPVEIQTQSASYIANYLERELEQHPVFLLLSGGSAIKMYKQVFEQLTHSTHLNHPLTVSLFDERFVSKNSPDSNEQQLKDANILELLKKLNAVWIPYLPERAVTGEETARQVSSRFIRAIEQAGHMVILAGIGSDGHTAGMLPTQDEETIKKIYGSAELIEYCELPADVNNPHRQRLTATPALITLADQVIIYAVGDDKKAALQDFAANEKSVAERPSLALHQSQSPVVILSDQEIESPGKI